MDEDWHAIFQAVYKGVEGLDCEVMYYQYMELHQADKRNKSNENHKANVFWAWTEAIDKSIDCFDVGHELKIQTKSQVTTASDGLEQGERLPSVTSEW